MFGKSFGDSTGILAPEGTHIAAAGPMYHRLLSQTFYSFGMGLHTDLLITRVPQHTRAHILAARPMSGAMVPLKAPELLVTDCSVVFDSFSKSLPFIRNGVDNAGTPAPIGTHIMADESM